MDWFVYVALWAAVIVNLSLVIINWRLRKAWLQRFAEVNHLMRRVGRYERLLTKRAELVKVNEAIVNEKLQAVDRPRSPLH